MTDNPRFSYSSLKKYLKCPRSYQLEYKEGLFKVSSSDKRNLIFGSHAHAAFERVLKYHAANPEASMRAKMSEAEFGLLDYRNQTFDNGRKVYSYEQREFIPDTEYFEMMDTVFEECREMLHYQIPYFQWGRYVVATLQDLLDDRAEKVLKHSTSLSRVTDPLIEWKFEYPLKFGETLVGVIDAVLWDRETHEYVLFDWKTRKSMPDDGLMALDGQLPLYAAVVNDMADTHVIARTVMYQMTQRPPQPVKLTPKAGKISTAAPASTWPVWASSVRALGEDPEKYRDTMFPKMRPDDDFTRLIEIPINPEIDRRTMSNIYDHMRALRYAESADLFPAVLNKGCEFCEFQPICRVFQTGGDVETIVNYEYQRKRRYITQEVD